MCHLLGPTCLWATGARSRLSADPSLRILGLERETPGEGNSECGDTGTRGREEKQRDGQREREREGQA